MGLPRPWSSPPTLAERLHAAVGPDLRRLTTLEVLQILLTWYPRNPGSPRG